jgi:Ca-activated chloride channel family protein
LRSDGEDLSAWAPGVSQQLADERRIKEMAEKKHIHMHDSIVMPYPEPQPIVQQNNDKFEAVRANATKSVKEEPVSTFSIDVDTASYTFMRKQLNMGVLPPEDSVRVEEYINYFNYDYALPTDKSKPFKPTVAVFQTPWNADTKLVHVGIKGYDIPKANKPSSNLVFLLDTSGSMNAKDKLPLLKNGFKMMVENLEPDDTVSIVTYAGSAGTVLEPTKVRNKSKIFAALDKLSAGGSTAGGQGIKLAYDLAQENYDDEAVNRVILATDGDFNVGIRNPEDLKKFVEKKRKTGVYLSVLGFGQGNYNDHLMQALAQNGNGNASYIDTLSEARKVLVEEANGTLFTIAKDVKIQMEFNPLSVAEYRLIGYETRALKREDFNNDKIDAGEIGAGHSVTALYEITPVGSKARSVDPLRYAPEEEGMETKLVSPNPMANEYGFLKVRYKLPNESKSKLLSTPITKSNEFGVINDPDQIFLKRAVPNDVRFAAAVAAYAQLLRGDVSEDEFSFDDVIKLAKGARGDDAFGYRSEFLNMVRLAKSARR